MSRQHEHQPHVCPWWLIRTFDNPLRYLVHSPTRLLGGLVHEGDACLDVGCGIGYFSIPMARLAGPSGSVTAVDVQPRMLEGVRKRAVRAGLVDRIRLQQARPTYLRLEGTFDFVLAFWSVHEASDQAALLRQIRAATRDGGTLLLVEPTGEVDAAAFERTLGFAAREGFANPRPVHVALSLAVLLDAGAPG